MTYDEIIRELYDSQFIENYTKQILNSPSDKTIQDDCIGEIWLMVLGKKENIIRLHREGGLNKVRQYFAGLISRQLHSSSSLIYRKYRRYILSTVPYAEITEKDYVDEY